MLHANVLLVGFDHDRKCLNLVRSVEDSNGAEAWRLIHCRHPPDSQNRQYALTQKIMTPANSWCGHAEAFESALRAWVLNVVEWERASGSGSQVHSDDEHDTEFSDEQFATGCKMQTVRLSVQLDYLIHLVNSGFPAFVK